MELDAGRIESCLSICDQLLAEPTADVLNLKAWAMATTSDERFYRPAEALELARRACELTHYAEAAFLDTLAVCEAALGNFLEAIRLMQLALLAVRADKMEDCQAHLALFQEGKPYRESGQPKMSRG
jgi:tetratricopeptide (TPR) repeat protein